MAERSLAEMAVFYAQRGWAVFPVAPRDKVPLIKGGTGCKAATSNLAQVRRWWTETPDANIGLHCGPQSGIWVLDVDAGSGGFDTLAMLEDEHGLLPRTLQSKTGGGGMHFFWRWPAAGGDGIRNSVGLRMADGARYPGIDLRAFGGYVVVPPSVHSSGRRYEWEVQVNPIPAPAWLVTLIQRREDPIAPPPRPRPVAALDSGLSRRAQAYVRRAVERCLEELQQAPQGQRHEALNLAAWNMGRLVGGGLLSREEIEPVLIEAGLALGKGSREVHRTVRQALDAGEKNPRELPPERPRDEWSQRQEHR
jgi:hypothetical protein